MDLAIKEAFLGIRKKDGGPFGAVIVKNGKVIARGHNEVLKNNDPTSHGEIVAIRKAGKKLKNFDLSGCEIYTSCYPCPMCLAAIYWARIKTVYYGCSESDAEKLGFDDKLINDIFKGNKKGILKMKQIEMDSCLKPFKKFNEMNDKKMY
ncbi:MAG: nucleoside deaminase [Candidatus Pacearchaeota archaeon]